MDEPKELSNDGYEWLMKTPLSMWSKHAFDHRCKSDHVTNNMTESFNHWINPYREKPILTLVDQLRRRLAEKMLGRYEKGCGYVGVLTPRTKHRLDLIASKARNCQILATGNLEYEVYDGFFRYIVNLNHKTCNCMLWEASGVPCKHAASAIQYRRGNLEEYCSEFFSIQRYLAAHQEMVHALPDISMAPNIQETNVLQPPPLKRLPGRPVKNRRREPGEEPTASFRRKTTSVKCDTCKEVGHNRRTCQLAAVKKKRPVQARKQKAPVSTSRMATRSQTTNASTVESMQEKKMRKMKEYLAKRRARMAGTGGAGGDAIGASSTSVTGGDAGAAGAGGDGGDGGAGTDFFEHLSNL
ncbi:hypothetical protein NE237_021234 [Protea cynaroides]|uniref:SWIM-type domain-containing protein n=1 Tax=Protea cynaroides TaxID=273540 RepID=A0A9Q0K2E8_9MAGN|nr:hypothetical protein NE237_021234 [Protea cynaroides]